MSQTHGQDFLFWHQAWVGPQNVSWQFISYYADLSAYIHHILYWPQCLYPPIKCSYPRCTTVLQLDALQAHQLHMKDRTHIKNPKHWIYQTCFILICNIKTSLQTVTPFYNGTLDKVTKQINLAITANWSMAGLLLFTAGGPLPAWILHTGNSNWWHLHLHSNLWYVNSLLYQLRTVTLILCTWTY